MKAKDAAALFLKITIILEVHPYLKPKTPELLFLYFINFRLSHTEFSSKEPNYSIQLREAAKSYFFSGMVTNGLATKKK